MTKVEKALFSNTDIQTLLNAFQRCKVAFVVLSTSSIALLTLASSCKILPWRLARDMCMLADVVVGLHLVATF